MRRLFALHHRGRRAAQNVYVVGSPQKKKADMAAFGRAGNKLSMPLVVPTK